MQKILKLYLINKIKYTFLVINILSIDNKLTRKELVPFKGYSGYLIFYNKICPFLLLTRYFKQTINELKAS